MYQTELLIIFVAVIIYRAYTKMTTTCGLLLIITHPPLTIMRPMRTSFDIFDYEEKCLNLA